MSDKILLIRMLGLGDVTCIGIPALRHYQKMHPNAEMHFLTYAAGEEIIKLADPDIEVHALKKGFWPENLLQAMETFLGLAETIIGQGYTKIVNLDTWFMPCFLAKFLKDAGEPVEGNLMGVSVQELLNQFQNQTLQPEYVNDPAAYIQSSWFGMHRWHTPWWQGEFIPDNGYPEFYLKSCCGFSDIDMDWHVNVDADKHFEEIRKEKKVIALAMDARTKERNYPYADQLKSLLTQEGYFVWTGFDGSESMKQTLAQLKASDLLVTVPSAPQWLATTVSCPCLVVCGDVDPRTLMPDFATDPNPEPVTAISLVESINSIFSEADSA